MPLVITTCTNRKFKSIPEGLHASAVPRAKIGDLASDWGRRLSAEPMRYPARSIYGGRVFQEAVLAANLLDARLMVVSAGLGLICASEQVPPYACTVLIDAPDSIADRVTGEFDPAGWWRLLNRSSPFARSLLEAATAHDGLICAALSDSYIEMFAEDLVTLPETVRARLRLFTRAPLAKISPQLRPYVMPYDDRLDGFDSPIRGTRGDFASRALHHFAEYIVTPGDSRSADQHARAIAAAQQYWRMAERFERRRLDDAAVLDLLRSEWDTKRGKNSHLLRYLRDSLNVACEQGRFKVLAQQVWDEQA